MISAYKVAKKRPVDDYMRRVKEPGRALETAGKISQQRRLDGRDGVLSHPLAKKQNGRSQFGCLRMF